MRSGLRIRSPVQQPEDETEDHADDDRGGERNVKAEVLTLDDNVAWTPPEAELAKHRPKQADSDQRDPKDNQGAAHGLPRGFSSSRMTFRQIAAKEDGVTHLARARPLRELHLCDQLRLDPGGYGLILHAPGERRFAV